MFDTYVSETVLTAARNAEVDKQALIDFPENQQIIAQTIKKGENEATTVIFGIEYSKEEIDGCDDYDGDPSIYVSVVSLDFDPTDEEDVEEVEDFVSDAQLFGKLFYITLSPFTNVLRSSAFYGSNDTRNWPILDLLFGSRDAWQELVPE